MRTVRSVLLLGCLVVCASLPIARAQEQIRPKVLDGKPKAFVVCGYSTSFQWPDMLQAKLDRLSDGKRVYTVHNAAVGGSPVARWIDVETGAPRRPYQQMLRRFFEAKDQKPAVALCQQSLQFVARGDGQPTPRKGPVNGPNDKLGIKIGAAVFGKLAARLHQDGCGVVFIAAHIYKKPMEPQIGNERLALQALVNQQLAYVRPGPDVWVPTKNGYPDLFARDLLHPNEKGAAVMAQLWFEALLKHDAREVPDWSRLELRETLGEALTKKVFPPDEANSRS